MSENTCPECNGSGVYQGLNTVEPCRACGGEKTDALRWMKTESHSIADVCQIFAVSPEVLRSGIIHNQPITRQEIKERFKEAEILYGNPDAETPGQSIRHEIEEQIAEPIEIPFPIHTMSQVSIDVDTRFGKGKRTENTLEMELVISSFICSLTDIIQSPSRYAEYKRLIQGQDRFTAIFQCGDDAKRIEDVMMVACQPSQDGAIASFILEWEPDDA